MIIYIDESIGKQGKINGLTEDEQFLYERLIVANKVGRCFLCGDPSSLEWLSTAMQKGHSGLYRKLYSRFPHFKAIIKSVERILVISYNQDAKGPVYFNGDCTVLTVPAACDYDIDQMCSLVGENLTDCAFYKLIAERYCIDHNIKGIQLSFRNELGGGSTIATVFEKCAITDKLLTFALIDSDIKYGASKSFPGDPPLGGTAKKLMDLHQSMLQRSLPATFDCYCLPVHEAENLIPITVLEEISNSLVPDMSNGVSYLKKLVKAGKGSTVLMYDFKDGGKRAKDNDGKHPALKAFWEEIADIIDDDSMPALCSKVLEKSVDLMQSNREDGEEYIVSVPIDEYLHGLWSSIGLKLVSWGCASIPTRA